MRYQALAFFALLLLAPPAGGAGDEPDWAAAEQGEVAAVLSGESLELTDGRVLRLAGLRAPRAPLGYAGAVPWRREVEAAAALQRLAPPGGRLALVAAEPAYDRHRRLRVQAAGPQGLWLQAALLAEGAVLLDAEPLPPEATAALLAAEAAARNAGRGLWADPAHALLPAEETARAIGRFAVVEGRVLAANVVRGTGYLNFGADWRSDFTIRLDPAARRAFERAGRAVEDHAGRRVRVRGWVFASGGPMIEARHPAQLELLPE